MLQLIMLILAPLSLWSTTGMDSEMAWAWTHGLWVVARNNVLGCYNALNVS